LKDFRASEEVVNAATIGAEDEQDVDQRGDRTDAWG
jgi:hypothetical protein